MTKMAVTKAAAWCDMYVRLSGYDIFFGESIFPAAPLRKNEEVSKMRIRKQLAVLLLVLLCGVFVSAAYAQEVPDTSRTGSISAVMSYGGAAVGGGTLTLYRVGDVSEDDGNYSFVLTDAFAASGLSLSAVSDAGLAQSLAEYAQANGIEGTAVQIGEDGTVSADGLPLGLYLVAQQEQDAAEGYEAISPFLVSVPMYENGAYSYSVNAEPKMSAMVPTAGPEETEEDPGEEETTPSTSAGTTTTTSSTLPQTGQLNWPVPVLAVAGLGLLLLGWELRLKGQRKSHVA